MNIGILTVSDKGYKGQREDESGKILRLLIEKEFSPDNIYCNIVPDEQDFIFNELIEMSDNKDCKLIVTSGGTGLTDRDCTPEATMAVIDKEVPGIAEAMRFITFKFTSRSVLSRAIAGIRGKTLIINLPGSPKAVKECMAAVLDPIAHAIELIHKGSLECGRS